MGAALQTAGAAELAAELTCCACSSVCGLVGEYVPQMSFMGPGGLGFIFQRCGPSLFGVLISMHSRALKSCVRPKIHSCEAWCPIISPIWASMFLGGVHYQWGIPARSAF